MKYNDLNNIYSLSLKIFTILKEEYSKYLSKDKLEFLDNLDIFKFYKIIDNKETSLYYFGNVYYINSNFDINLLEQLVPFLCFSALCSNINPLKIGLIEKELIYLKEKYELPIKTYFYNELNIADLVSKTLLSTITDKIVFKENDADIVNYLTKDLGSKYGICYSNVSKNMKQIKEKSNDFWKNNIDYNNVSDIIYDFISEKIRK